MKRIVAAALASALSTTCLAAGLPTPNLGIGTQLNGVTLRPPGTSGATTSLNNGNNTTSGNNTHTGVESFTTPPIFSLTGILYGNGGSAMTTIAPSAVLDLLSSTRGTVLYRGASGWVPLSGAAGTVVQFNGAGNDPTAAFPPAADPAARHLLNTLTASNSAALQDTTSLTSAYSEYELDCDGLIPSSSGYDMIVQLRVGGAWQTSGYNSVLYTYVSGSALGQTYANGIGLGDSLSTSRGLSTQVHFNNPTVSNITLFNFNGGSWRSTSTAAAHWGTGMYGAAGAITGIQVVTKNGATASTIASGYCKIYGFN